MTQQRMPSLVDVGVILTGKDARHVSRDIQCTMEKYPDLAQKVGQVSFGGRGGNRDSLVPQDLPTLIEVIFLLPGRAAAQIFVRYLGGDLSLIGEVQQLRHIQENLGDVDPEHPLRLFGAAVEAVPEAAERREEMELVVAHKKRMLELEYQAAQKRLCWDEEAAAAAKALREEEAAAAKARREEEAAAAKVLRDLEADAERKRHASEVQQAATAQHEAFRRERALSISANTEAWRVISKGGDLTPRTRRSVEDQLRTGLQGDERVDAELGRPVYLSQFLEKKLLLKPWAATERAKVFGRKVKLAVQSRFPDYGIGTANRSVDGQQREPNLYFEAHTPAILEALEEYKASMPPLKDDELTQAGVAEKKAELTRKSNLLLSGFLRREPLLR
jgi:hypothetical protein